MTEKEAIRRVQELGAGYDPIDGAELRQGIQALAVMVNANRIHLQALKGELEEIRRDVKFVRDRCGEHSDDLTNLRMSVDTIDEHGGKAIARLNALEERLSTLQEANGLFSGT